MCIRDRPTGNLDPTVGEEILKLFRSINTSGTAVLMATHNYNFLDAYPERVLKLDDKKMLDSEKEEFSFGDIF